MYILDEVDAALDLSHTQNIGTMLRTRFKGAQFIVVSLKEGMFNNANVLFRAKFVNGVSFVERIAERSKKPAQGKTISAATPRPQNREAPETASKTVKVVAAANKENRRAAAT